MTNRLGLIIPIFFLAMFTIMIVLVISSDLHIPTPKEIREEFCPNELVNSYQGFFQANKYYCNGQEFVCDYYNYECYYINQGVSD